jgi:hypothetical protein
MFHRLAACGIACVLGFGTLAMVASLPAGAYASPTAGTIEPVAGNGTQGYSGDGGLATTAQMRGDGQVAIDPATGNLVIADALNYTVRVLAAVSGTFYGQAMTADHIYTIAGNGTYGFSGDNGPGQSAQLSYASGVAVDAFGDVVIADADNHRIRVVPVASGVFFGTPYTAGYIYTLVGTGTPGFSGDGGPMASAQLQSPRDVALDASGNLLIADTTNNRLRVVAGSTGTFYGQAMTALDIYTIAGGGGSFGDGGPATAAQLDSPWGLDVDTHGNVLFADLLNQRIRVVAETTGTFYGVAMTSGDIYTIAGNGGGGGYGSDGVSATATALNFPTDVAVDGEGNAVIADTNNHRVRLVAATSTSTYGQSMTGGFIYTIAGNGSAGASGDGGLATAAGVPYPHGLAIDASGNVVIEDYGSFEVRVVAPYGFTCPPPAGPPSALTVSSTVAPASLAPPQSASSQFVATVHNPGGSAETCVSVHFTVDVGTLDAFYGVVSQGTGCTFTVISGSKASAVDCALGTVAPGADATAAVAIQPTGVKAPATITGTATTASSLSGGASTQSQVSVVAPVPGVVDSFVPPSGSTSTDKAPSATATIIAKMHLPKYVRAGYAALPNGADPSATTLVTSAGAQVAMNRYAQSSDSVLCPANSCRGDIITLAPFVNYTDPAHPAVLTLTWDASVVDPNNLGSLYIRTDSNPGTATPVPACATKVHGVYPALPCVSKTTIATKGKLIGSLKIVVQILSSNDPGFCRR